MSQCDILIAGAGAAGLSLAVKICQSKHHQHLKVVLLDKDEKTKNDRTWSYWTNRSDAWDEIVHQRWNKLEVKGQGKTLNLDLGDYEYRTIRGIDFYNYCREVISKSSNVTWKKDEIVTVLPAGHEVIVTTKNGMYNAQWFADSRPPSVHISKKKLVLHQHFGGWVIKTEQPVFDAGCATLMDFERPQHDEVRFMYVLPYSENTALVEYTGFGKLKLEPEEYEAEIRNFLEQELNAGPYEIVEREFATILMTQAIKRDILLDRSKRVIPIGARGGAIKASTGYAFHRIQRQVDFHMLAFELGLPPKKWKSKGRHRMYDRMLLRILYKNTYPGDKIFMKMFEKHPVDKVFRFLDEETTFGEEVGIMAKSPQWPFIAAFFREIMPF